jgi:hypothetical protein
MPTLYSFGKAKIVGTAVALGDAGVNRRRSDVKGDADMQAKRLGQIVPIA